MKHKLYEALGIQRNASTDEIKKAYRKSAMQHHPDKGGDETKFKEITNAYEILSNDEKRNQYDQLGDENFQNANNGGRDGGGFPGGMNPHDIFAQMFAGMGGSGGGGFPGNTHFEMNFGHQQHQQHQQHRNYKRQDHAHGMHINLNEAYTGSHKTIQINLQKICLLCKETCNNCQGRGQITNMVRAGIFTQIMNQPCNTCNGSGSITKGRDKCSECNGKWQYNEDKRVEIDIPSGVSSGHQIRLNGMGEQKQSKDDIPGDLILQIQVNDHQDFQREGNNLKFVKELTFKDAILGKKFTIKHFSGEMEVNTRDFGIIESAKKYEIAGKGMPLDGNKTRYGNLILQFNVIYPSKKLTLDDVTVLESAFNTINL